MRHYWLIAIIFVLAGCVNLDPVPETTRYFMLDQNLVTAEAPMDTSFDRANGEAFHIMRPVIPEYLNTPRIFYRTSTGEPRYTSRERWAEAMEDSLPRTLARHLANLGGMENISYYPAATANTNATRIQWEIIQFEGIEGRGVVIDLHYRIGDQPRQRLRQEIRLESFDQIEVLIGAMNDLIARTARAMIE